MKTLFNKDGNGTNELKDLMSYIDADLDYKSLEADLITTTNDVIALVGYEIYQAAEAVYEDDFDDESLEGKFLRAMRYPIAVNGYRLYSPTNDLSHTNNGRKMRSDDSEKTPFEWMIDRDNAAQEKRYFRALDDLIVFLDRMKKIPEPETAEAIFENALATLWTGSEAYKLTHNLLIRTVAEFDRVFPIRSRLLLNNLSQGMDDCEVYEIASRVGQAVLDGIKEKVKNKTPLDPKEVQLVKFIKQAIVGYSLAWAMQRFSVNLFPDGVLQHYTSDRATTRGQKPALNIEPEMARLAFQSDADKALLKIEELMSPVPEINDCAPIHPQGDCDDKFFSA